MTTFAKTFTHSGFSSGLLSETIARLKQHMAKARTQRLLRELDDHQLADIGLTRHDVR